ncbi:MAG: diguanylate cyclase [Nitrospiraceae bacterium]|nr:diguanylate cyclase [Nitrospiraceae bacterium]
MKTIVVISQDIILTNIVDRALRNLYKILVFTKIQPALDYIYNAMPDLIVLATDTEDFSSINILNGLRQDPMFNQLPVLAVLPDQFVFSKEDSFFAEDYIWEADLEKEILTRVNLCILRSKRVVEINPLTRLPGNIAINRQIQDRLDKNKDFALAYADLDYFKPFNDYYGFSRGDEVIKITGRLILNIVKSRQPYGSFIGHIGGDDFIFMMDLELIEKTSQEIIDAFDKIIPTFYDPKDRTINYIESFDRQGHARRFPIISISIGVTKIKAGTLSHYGEVTERASEMKKYAKQFKNSCCRLDKRKDL